MKVPFWNKVEVRSYSAAEVESEKRAAITNYVQSLQFAEASGNEANAQQTNTAAAEFGVRLMADGFTSAIVEPAGLPELSATIRAQIMRELMTGGNSTWLIEVGSRGRVLTPCWVEGITGDRDPASWRYDLRLPSPDTAGEGELLTNQPSKTVVHFRINVHPARPWQGQSPLLLAGYSAQWLANLDARIRDEANMPVGELLTVPDGLGKDERIRIGTERGKSKGGWIFVESSGGSFTIGTQQAKQGVQIQRFGPNIPQSSLLAHDAAVREVLGVMRIPAVLMLGGDGAQVREGYRQFLTAGLQPIGDLIAEELSAKLEEPIEFNFRRLQAADVANRARAMGTMVAAGMTIDQAMMIADLLP